LHHLLFVRHVGSSSFIAMRRRQPATSTALEVKARVDEAAFGRRRG
jgi:hypothetical protein